jgi:hypothetical protein
LGNTNFITPNLHIYTGLPEQLYLALHMTKMWEVEGYHDCLGLGGSVLPFTPTSKYFCRSMRGLMDYVDLDTLARDVYPIKWRAGPPRRGMSLPVVTGDLLDWLVDRILLRISHEGRGILGEAEIKLEPFREVPF